MSENSTAVVGRPASFRGPRKSRATTATSPVLSLRWRPSANGNGPQLIVTRGDLTTCTADAIVNPANSGLVHGGGVAGAIASKGGRVIDDESKAWIDKNKRLPVGHAMSTRSGKLACRFVIHTVGPMVGGGGYSYPTDEQTQQLRDAVRSALEEADNLQLSSIAMPGISTGYFGYPCELAAMEIVGECVRFACEKADATTLTTIVLMNIDIPTCRSFAQALQETAVLCGHEGMPEQVLGDPVSNHCYQRDDDDEVKNDEEVLPAQAKSTGWSSLWRKPPITIVPVRVGATDFELLLGVETSSFGFAFARRRCVDVFSGDGGKLWENGVEAKSRVLSKAVGGVVAIDTLRDSIKHSSCELRLESMDTTLTFVCLDRDCAQSLPHKFEQWRMKSWLSTAAIAHLVWIPWQDLKALATTPARPSFRYDEGKLRTPFGVFPLATTLSQAIKKHGADVENQLQSLLLKETIAHEIDRVATLHATSDDELLARVLGRDWKLRLTSPEMPPPTPLELLTPKDPDYKAFVSELPVHVASRIVSVRRVRASARRGEYQKAKQEITDPRVKEIQPLFHGTPERWRATAIALNGFDLAIQLHGRAYGHGVYTSTDVNTALGYTSNQGSILRLRGLVASNCRANKGFNTVVNGCVHVFPNPKAVLPVAIADYAADDERDQVERKRQQAHAEYSNMQKRRRAVEMEMSAKEDEFKQRAQKRLRVALDVYSSSLAKVQAVMMAPVATSERSASRQFFQERRHFEQCLPMYEVKPALVQLLRTTPITVIVADTGSGKSTQLPQILLDDVLPTTETRRIAILEPRRINATSLSKRVSEERGSVPGQEVGYTIGRGDSNVSLGVTRLEYMTHGLFVQLARDPAYLVKHYCAVIVDEAHERSVDVDLSLALLQRVLKQQQQQQSGGSFHVIVTSATIEEEAQKIQRYLDPSLQQSAVFRVHGRTFPVYVEHRNDVQVDRTALGTANVGKVLTSAAIQSAVELLRTTEKGNILVFLPGEGSINEALAVARSEIAMSATVETVDTFSSRSSAFCFRMSTLSADQQDDYDGDSSSSTQRNIITTYVVGFHGKITRAERDRVLHPWDSHTRWVVFTTNIAETGVTLPNVRYVIDTGLERRVRWNATLDMNEMVTAPISKSSMAQRAGRAGRTASGICIRLYPDEATSEFASPAVVPSVQNAMIYKAVLLMKELESRGEERLELLDPIEPKTWAQAQQRLVALGALDADDATLTQEGAALLRLGIDLRLGRFLIACARFGCLATGVKLVSLLVATDAPERLLPNRFNATRAERIKSLIDPSGDHLTLLNVFEAYENAHKEGRAMAWCQRMGFTYDVFVEAEIAREYLLKVLDGLHFPLMDNHKAMAKADGKRACIRRALCAAFFDQLARPRMASTATKGFVRVLDQVTSHQIQRNAVVFASQTQATGEEDKSDDERGQANATEATKEAAVKLGSGSTMWLKEIATALASTDELVVFGSLILTDGSTQCDATVHLVTHVTAEDVKTGASQWCRLVDFDALLQQSSRKSLVFDLPGGLARSFVMNGGAWLKNLQRLFGSSVVATVQHDKLHVSCPRHRRPRVEHYLRKRIPFVAPESVVIRLPDHVNMGQLLGKQGQQIESLRAGIEQLLASQDCGAGHEHVRTRPLYVDADKKTITVTLQGASKPMMSVVVGHVQSKITQLLGADTLPLALDASGERGQQMQRCPRLAQLLNHVAPTSWNTRDDVMLQIAHALVWKCDASIHGGFVRDWVVRGDAANDIDVQLAPPRTTETSIEEALTAFLAETPDAVARALVVSNKWSKGVARTLTITGHGLAVPIDVDLVDRENLKSVVAPPGVDCDAGNLLLNRTESLRKKIRSTGGSLSVALENVHEKRFDFYYSLEPGGPHQAMSVARLKKYLARGWTCVSHVPRAVQAHLSENERALLGFSPAMDGDDAAAAAAADAP